MDGSRFDQLAKNLVTRIDRRRVLQGVSGAVAAVLGTTLGMEVTEAKQSKRRKQRVRAQRNAGGGKPQGRCDEGQTNCRGTCVNLTNNPAHCGACATLCAPHEVCAAGKCVCPAPAPNRCPATGLCLPACTGGKVFDEATCECGCVPGSCCACNTQALSFCRTDLATQEECDDACPLLETGDRIRFSGGTSGGFNFTNVCAPSEFEFSCAQTCSEF